VDDVGVGRVGCAVGRAIGIGIVRERRFELRDAEDSDRIERVSMKLSSLADGGGGGGMFSNVRGRFVSPLRCAPPPHWPTRGDGAGAGASIASSRVL
jgi:hypothetical protein